MKKVSDLSEEAEKLRLAPVKSRIGFRGCPRGKIRIWNVFAVRFIHGDTSVWSKPCERITSLRGETVGVEGRLRLRLSLKAKSGSETSVGIVCGLRESIVLV